MNEQNVKKYSCSNCNYFFYVDAQSDDYPDHCPYCSCEVVDSEMVDFVLPSESCHAMHP